MLEAGSVSVFSLDGKHAMLCYSDSIYQFVLLVMEKL